MEWLTGGDVLACKYEVVVRNKTTSLAINEAKELGRILWRASSTVREHEIILFILRKKSLVFVMSVILTG
jgi:hypothetical protein